MNFVKKCEICCRECIGKVYHPIIELNKDENRKNNKPLYCEFCNKKTNELTFDYDTYVNEIKCYKLYCWICKNCQEQSAYDT